MARLTVLLFLSLCVLVACGDQGTGPANGTPSSSTATEESAGDSGAQAPHDDPQAMKLVVDGMSCAQNCAPKVQNLLAKVEGIKAAEVVFEEKTAYLVLEDPSADRAQLQVAARAALEGTNFKIVE